MSSPHRVECRAEMRPHPSHHFTLQGIYNYILTFNLECELKAFSKSASDILAEPVAAKRATLLEGRGGLREPVDRVEPCVRALALLPQELTLSLSSYKTQVTSA